MMKSPIACFLGLCAFASAARADATDFSLLDEQLRSIKVRADMPSGAAIVVIKEDEVVYEGYFGLADIEAGAPVDADTRFYIASTTKAFFALAALLAEHRGDLSASTTLQQLFPNTGFQDIDPNAVTVKHLLTHTSGLENEAFTWAASYSGQHDAELRQRLVAAVHPDSETALGEFKYTNLGYNVMSVWFENFYGRDWRLTLDEFVLAPLGMDETTGFMSDIAKRGWTFAKPYSYKHADGKKRVYLQKDDSTMYSIGLVSTARDVAKFIVAQINEGAADGRQVFPAEIIRKSHAQQASANSYYNGYAWGWQLSEFEGHREIFHTGGFTGASALISFLPDQKIGIVALQNESGLKANYLGSIVKDLAYSALLDADRSVVKARAESLADDLVGRVEQAKAELAATEAQKLNTPWQLSLEKSAYLGAYSHPLAGAIVVTRDDSGALSARWGNLLGKAYASAETDRMDFNFRPGAYYTAAFHVHEGAVERLSINGYTFARLKSR